MKTLKFSLLTLVALIFLGCGGLQKDKIVGVWKLTGFRDGDKIVELSDCDKQTVWDFTTESAEALSDGTEVEKLNGIAPNECKF